MRQSHSSTGILLFQPGFIPAFTSLKRATLGSPERIRLGMALNAVFGSFSHFLGCFSRGTGSATASINNCNGCREFRKRNPTRSMVPKILEAAGKLDPMTFSNNIAGPFPDAPGDELLPFPDTGPPPPGFSAVDPFGRGH